MLALTLRPACCPGSVRMWVILPTLSEVLESGPASASVLAKVIYDQFINGREKIGKTYHRRACTGPSFLGRSRP